MAERDTKMVIQESYRGDSAKLGFQPENKTYKPDGSQRPVIPQGGIGGSAVGPQSPIAAAPPAQQSPKK